MNNFKNKNINLIKDHFDKLNLEKDHFVTSNDICTPIGCVEEMVEKIPLELWGRKDLKILDCCCGNGNFHAYISTKTSLKNLYFNEINKKRIKNLFDYFGEDINFTEIDFLEYNESHFLEYDQDDKYDLIVANPPYAKFNQLKRSSKNHNLSRAFIEKALSLTKNNGYILFIVPNNWMSFSDRNILPKELSQYQFIHLDIHGAKKWFKKVGSSFTWFILQKSENENEFSVENNYIIKDTQTVKLDKKQRFIPLYLSEITMSIVNKVVNVDSDKYIIETTSDLHKTTKKHHISDKYSEKFCHRLIHTPTKMCWSDRPHKFQDGYKVFISLTNQYSTFVDDCGMTQSIAFIRCKDKDCAEKIKKELDDDIYKFIVNITRYGNFNNIRVLQNLSHLSKIELNDDEACFVKKFNSKYYKL